MAVVGNPAAGSHSLGLAIVPSSSCLPHARIFRVGSRVMWSGTMSQATGEPHLPVVASGGSGFRVTVLEVTPIEPVVNRIVWAPVPDTPRSVNWAEPLAWVVAVRVP